MSVMRLASSVFVAAALVVSGALAQAEPAGGGTDALARGRALVRAFEYDAAMAELESVLSNSSATATQRIQALELMALLQMNLGRQAQATEIFERLLNLDPGHELTDPELPPRAQELFTKTRSSFVHSARTTVEAQAAEAPSRDAVDIQASLGGSTDGVERVVTFIRGAGEPAYRRALMDRDGLGFTASVPAPGQGALEYYVEAQAPSGHALATAGAPDEPLRVTVTAAAAGDGAPGEGGDGEDGDGETPPRERRRWYRSWWFWTIVGVAVAGGATATAVVLTRPEEQEQGSLGNLNLP